MANRELNGYNKGRKQDKKVRIGEQQQTEREGGGMKQILHKRMQGGNKSLCRCVIHKNVHIVIQNRFNSLCPE